MRLKLLILIGLLLCTMLRVEAQKKKDEHKIKEATGVAIGGAESTLLEIKTRAINNAKIDALKQAGIEEHINSYTDYFRSESDNAMGELFTSDVLSNIRGVVTNIEELSFDKEFTAEGQIKATVKISCVVIEYISDKDLTFDVWVEKIKGLYKEGDGLEFEIKPTKDCYLRAFMFSPVEDFMLFPNDYESSFKIASMQAQNFPSFKGTYVLDAGGEARELNRLILVFLKQDIPYTGKVVYKDIIDWIMTIPPDERVIKSFSFDVYKDVE